MSLYPVLLSLLRLPLLASINSNLFLLHYNSGYRVNLCNKLRQELILAFMLH